MRRIGLRLGLHHRAVRGAGIARACGRARGDARDHKQDRSDQSKQGRGAWHGQDMTRTEAVRKGELLFDWAVWLKV